MFCQHVCSLGIEPTTFAFLTQCVNHWATGTLVHINSSYWFNLVLIFKIFYIPPTSWSYNTWTTNTVWIACEIVTDKKSVNKQGGIRCEKRGILHKGLSDIVRYNNILMCCWLELAMKKRKKERNVPSVQGPCFNLHSTGKTLGASTKEPLFTLLISMNDIV